MAITDTAALQGVSKSILSKVIPISDIHLHIDAHPRDKKVIVCHGIFDIVHPGHLNLLLNAKQKAGILIAGIIADDFLTEEQSKAGVNENVRAMSLAALECVDYVVIDRHAEPTNLIEQVQPDFFLTGFSYFESSHSNSLESVKTVLDRCGGELLLTGNQTFSSRARSADILPSTFSAVKLALSLRSEELTLDEISSILDHSKEASVHIIGDSFLDCYTQCRIGGPSPKTPSVSVELEHEEQFLGGAARVALQFAKAGIRTTISTMVGDDSAGETIIERLKSEGVYVNALVDTHRKTGKNIWYCCRDQRIFQVRQTDSKVIPARLSKDLEESLKQITVDACVFVDYRLGMLNTLSIPSFVKAIPKSTLKVADCQAISRWGNILDYQEFDLITPNQREAQYALGDQDSILKSLANELMRRAKCKTLMLKLGSNGVIVFRNSEHKRNFFSLDSFASNVVDSMGAGDAFLTYATLGMIFSKSDFSAALLGSVAASIKCRHLGFYAVNPDEIKDFISMLGETMDNVGHQIEKVLVDQ